MSLIKKILKSTLKFYCSKFVKVNPNTILVLEGSYPSGSNTNIIYKKLKDTKKFKIEFMNEKDFYLKSNSINEILKYLKKIITISNYNIIICSHGHEKYNNKQILIDLWHGIPLKAMRYMETKSNEYSWNKPNADFLITTSKLHSVLMGSTLHIPFSKHKILGYPRNDYLFSENNYDLLNIRRYNKILLYMPTFRQGYLDRIEGNVFDNLFNFEKFSEEDFVNYLIDNNYLLIVKLHPMEEKLYKSKYSKYKNNIMFLSTEKLEELEIDLYQILSSTDLLITDYSSIYFDYLLLNKPIVFINSDIEEYRKKRGILLEPYDYWTPGYKVNNQKGLVYAIEQSFKQDPFYEKRNELKNIFHYYQDGNSTERFIKFLDEIMVGKK